jgi:hypothetical protein
MSKYVYVRMGENETLHILWALNVLHSRAKRNGLTPYQAEALEETMCSLRRRMRQRQKQVKAYKKALEAFSQRRK